VLGQAELVVIDEAAAIPLPLVRNLIGAYLVFLASTVHGYEGTGRSLSLKLVQQLRENAVPQETTASREVFPDVSSAPKPRAAHKILPKARSLKEITLEDSIRYSAGDKIEKWLNSLLCLDASVMPRLRSQGCPHPSSCELFYVNRDTLFSYHPASEVFLQRMMALYVASHYRNQPNDLQLLSDAPAHHLFVLLPHIRDDEECLPEPLVVLQVALEGQIRSEAVMDGLGRGSKVAGDMIPWLISQQFQESKFAMLSGARVVRVATHPDCTNVSPNLRSSRCGSLAEVRPQMGYGSRALQALNSFYKGEYLDLEETSPPELTTASDSVCPYFPETSSIPDRLPACQSAHRQTNDPAGYHDASTAASTLGEKTRGIGLSWRFLRTDTTTIAVGL
jgi:N-acetyltransferase 10